MTNKEEMEQLKQQAHDNIQSLMISRRVNKTPYEIEREHWLNALTGYSPEAAHIKYLEDTEKEQQELLQKELQLLIEADRRHKEGLRIGWQLVQETLIPTTEDWSTPLPDGWKHKFIDGETKKKSPTLLEIVKKIAAAMVDPTLAINDANAFAERLIEIYDRRMLLKFVSQKNQLKEVFSYLDLER